MDDTGTDIETLTEFARLMGSSTRLILWNTIGPVGMYPSDLATTLSLSLATVSFHLARLHDAGLVSFEQQGRNRLYRWTDLRLAIVPESDLRRLTAQTA